MRVLVLGSGGREHALAYRLGQDKTCSKVYVVPGNPGMIKDLINTKEIDIYNFAKVYDFILEERIDLVIVGPENLLEKGVVDFFKSKKIAIVGPSKSAAKLETSKVFSKEIMKKYNIPTASFRSFSSYTDAMEGLENFAAEEVVVKASTLAAGKGVVVCNDKKEAAKALYNFFENEKYIVKTNEVLLEEKLIGKEISAFALFDENRFINLGYAQDYKRLLDNDLGPNTGGMGSISGCELISEKLKDKINEEVFTPILNGMKKEKNPFCGILFAGLMIDGDDLNVIEFNVRLGDPETQSILPRIKGDLTKTFWDQSQNELDGNLLWDKRSVAHIVMCSENYPGIDGETLILGQDINIEKKIEDTKVFYGGVNLRNKQLVNSGGRVLGVSAFGNNLKEAKIKGYEQISCIKFFGARFRKDIGHGH